MVIHTYYKNGSLGFVFMGEKGAGAFVSPPTWYKNSLPTFSIEKDYIILHGSERVGDDTAFPQI